MISRNELLKMLFTIILVSGLFVVIPSLTANAVEHNVNNEIQLAEALQSGSAIINLTNDISDRDFTHAIFSGQRDIVINLNGHRLSLNTTADSVISINNGATLTVNGPGTFEVRNSLSNSTVCAIDVEGDGSKFNVVNEAIIDLRNSKGNNYNDAYMIATNGATLDIAGIIYGYVYATDNGIATVFQGIRNGYIYASSGGIVTVTGDINSRGEKRGVETEDGGKIEVVGDITVARNAAVRASGESTVTVIGSVDNSGTVYASNGGMVTVTGVSGSVSASDGGTINVVGNILLAAGFSQGVYATDGSIVTVTGSIVGHDSRNPRGDVYAYKDSTVEIGGDAMSIYTYDGGTVSVQGDIYSATAESGGKVYIHGDITGHGNNVTIGAFPNEVVLSVDNPVRTDVVLPHPYDGHYWNEFNDENKNPVDGISYVYVSQGLAKIEINKTSTVISVGDTERLSVIIYPINEIDTPLVWTSSNEEVAIVDGNGQVTAISQGVAYITVVKENSEITATCKVTVELAIVETPAIPDSNDTTINEINEDIGNEATQDILLDEDSNEPSDSSNTLIIAIACGLVLVFSVCAVLFVMHKKKKSRVISRGRTRDYRSNTELEPYLPGVISDSNNSVPMRYCVNCGNKLINEAVFCDFCGHKQ